MSKLLHTSLHISYKLCSSWIIQMKMLLHAFFLLNATSKRVVCSRLTVMGNKSLDQIINLVKYCHMTGENTGVEIASADKTLLTAIFPISDGPGAVNIWRGCKVCPGEGHFARSREPAGKNTVVHAGSPGSWKATSKKLWIILSAKYIFFEDCRAIRALLLPFKLFLCCE